MCYDGDGLGVDRMTWKIKPGARQDQPKPGVGSFASGTDPGWGTGGPTGQRVKRVYSIDFGFSGPCPVDTILEQTSHPHSRVLGGFGLGPSLVGVRSRSRSR